MKMFKEDFASGRLQTMIAYDSVKNRIRGLAFEIFRYYQWCKNDEELMVIGLNDGAGMFLYHLIRDIPFRILLNTVKVKSYNGCEKIQKALYNIEEFVPMTGKHVLIVDDILDTGETLERIMELVKATNPISVKLAVLLNKYKERKNEIKPDFCCFNIEDKFVVGFGMDYNNYYRNLTDICIFCDK